MSKEQEEQLRVIETMLKNIMKSAGLKYTQYQAEQLADFVLALVLVSREIGKDYNISRIRR